jgi:hypothetical protein
MDGPHLYQISVPTSHPQAPAVTFAVSVEYA